MTWFKRQSGDLDPSGERKVRTEGLWVKCESCRQIIWKKDLEDNINVCPKCDKHFRIDARDGCEAERHIRERFGEVERRGDASCEAVVEPGDTVEHGRANTASRETVTSQRLMVQTLLSLTEVRVYNGGAAALAEDRTLAASVFRWLRIEFDATTN